MLYRRGRIWYVRFQAQGLRVNQSAHTSDKRKAAQLEQKLRAEHWYKEHLSIDTSKRFVDAIDLYLALNDRKRSISDDRLRLMVLHRLMGDVSLQDATGARIASALDKRGVSPATRNRYYSVVRCVLRTAQQRGWIDRIPELRNMPERPKSPKWFTRQEAARLLAALDTPERQHLRDIVEFALATGLREANVTGLKWGHIINGMCCIPLEDAKGMRTLRIPLNQTARTVIYRRQGIHPCWVFTYKGRRLRKANRDGLQSAMMESGLEGGFHTLRHTWASWHVQAGTPLAVLKELGGWRTLDMVVRYAHLAPADIDRYAANVDTPPRAGVAELVDAPDSKSGSGDSNQ